jgi:long-chain acyl-CoA synthetase
MKPTPVRIHDALPDKARTPRFHLPTEGGGWRPVTWGEVDEAVGALALHFEAEGLPRGAPVCIFAPNRVEWLYAALAAQAAGGVMVPIYPSSTAAQAGYVIEHSGAFAVVVDSQPLLERLFASGALAGVRRVVLLGEGLDLDRAEAKARAAGVEVPRDARERTVELSEALARGRARRDADPGAYGRLLDRLRREDPCLMLYTSGTTGNPKGVPLTWDNVNSSSEDWIEVLGGIIPETPIDLFWLPMSHIYGWGEACLGFELEFTSYLTTPQEVLGLFEEVRPTVFMSVPAYWEKLAAGALAEPTEAAQVARLEKDTGGRLAFGLSGGAGLDRSVKEVFEKAGLVIIEGYGLTEASPTLTMNRPDAYRFDSVGRPFPRVELRLAEDGEILAKGPNVFSGYHRDPEATRAAFTEDGWLKTGDLGRLTEDGFLQIVGRKKEILVTAGGKNVPPANIELQLAGDDLIDHLVVYGDGKKYLVAGVWLNAEASAGRAREELEAEVARRIEAVNARLAKHETIKKHRIMSPALTVESGLVTPTLKVKRKKVYDAFRDSFEAMYA